MALFLLSPSFTCCLPRARLLTTSPELLLLLRPPLSLEVHPGSPLRPWHQLPRTARSCIAVILFRPNRQVFVYSGSPALCAVAAGEVISDGSATLFGTHSCPQLASPWPEPPATSPGSHSATLSDGAHCADAIPTKIRQLAALIICLTDSLIAHLA